MDTAWIAASASLIVAVVTFALNQQSLRRQKLRQDLLERTNRQLAELYGPLLATVLTSSASIHSLRSKLRPGQDKYFRGDVVPLTEDEFETWRLWIEQVFMPANRVMRDLVNSKSDLLLDETIPDCLLALCAHVQEYEVISRRWSRGDFSETDARQEWSDFGPVLQDYLVESFSVLKSRQAKLLRSILRDGGGGAVQ